MALKRLKTKLNSRISIKKLLIIDEITNFLIIKYIDVNKIAFPYKYRQIKI